MTKMFHYIKIIFLLLFTLILSCTYQNIKKDQPVTLTILTIGNTTINSYNKSGITATELLKIDNRVKQSLSNYIKCINNVCSNKEFSWIFYINGKKATLNPNSYILKPDDNIELKYE